MASVGGGDLGLSWRGWALRGVEFAFRAGMVLGVMGLLALGGWIPVGRRWLEDDLESWSDVVATLGGVWVSRASAEPGAEFGPVIARRDASELFQEIRAVARLLGVRPPEQVRLAALPCCAMLAWGRTHALIIGLPLLAVLQRLELRGILAHEMAHRAGGDTTHLGRSLRFVETLAAALDEDENDDECEDGDESEERSSRVKGPLGWWSRRCLRWGVRWAAPIGHAQEFRADRVGARIAGGPATASALIKVAMVQPLFREAVTAYASVFPLTDDDDDDHGENGGSNNPVPETIFSYFRTFWNRLPADFLSVMRLHLLSAEANATSLSNKSRFGGDLHPPLVERLALIQQYGPPHASPDLPAHPEELAATCLGDLEALEQMLHNTLFRTVPQESGPVVFHRAGT